jgi:TM2 domain-containing membrane protein YozV
VKTGDFIPIARYASVILWSAVSVLTVSIRAEELMSDAVDTASVKTGSVWSSIDTVLVPSKSIPPSVDTASTQSVLTPPAPRTINYTGVAFSAFIPGSGQIYQSRYVMGGLFFAAEAAVVGFAVNRSRSADTRSSNARYLRFISDTLNTLSSVFAGDTVMRDSLLSSSGRYAVLADEADFEERMARHTVYNALAWAVGLHLYNFLDALESGGCAARGLEKNPTTAGFLAAVPFLGLGQLYNERPSKAGMVAMAQIGLVLTACNQHRLMNIASEKYNEMRDSTSTRYAYRADYLSYWNSRYDNAFSRRNTYLWLSLFTYLYSIFDAVVDAYLSDFDSKIDLGTDLSVAPIGGGVAVSVTVGLKKAK